MHIDYRQLTLDDVEQLSELRWQFKIEESSEIKHEFDTTRKTIFIRDCSEFLIENFNLFTHFGAFKEEQLISIASINRIKKIPKPNRINDEFGYLTNMFTIEQYRSKGISKALLSLIKNWAKKNDFELMIVWPSDLSVKFYNDCGFEAINQPLILTLRDE